MILHRNCEGTEQLRLVLMSRLSNDVSVKNMSSDLLSGQTLNRGSEEQTVSDRSLSTHCSICRLITGTRCIIPCKGKSQPSGAYRFKLPVLVNHPYNRIRKYRTHDTIHNNCAYRNLPFIRLVSGFTIDQVGQQIPVALCKGYFRNISPCRSRASERSG